MEYLGHKVNSDGIHPTADKIKAIKDAPQPRNATELKSFLGLLSYYSKFLPNMSTTLACVCAAPKEQEVEIGKGTTRSS